MFGLGPDLTPPPKKTNKRTESIQKSFSARDGIKTRPHRQMCAVTRSPTSKQEATNVCMILYNCAWMTLTTTSVVSGRLRKLFPDPFPPTDKPLRQNTIIEPCPFPRQITSGVLPRPTYRACARQEIHAKRASKMSGTPLITPSPAFLDTTTGTAAAAPTRNRR